MPSPTLEQLKQREASIKKALAGLGETPDRIKRRDLRKKLKRVQRRRRTETLVAARNAPKAEAKAAAKPAEAPKAEEKPAAEAPAEAAAEEKKDE
jgi:hypothetical protein